MRKRGYHHGNLREALVEAAIALVAEKGPLGFTFADAARAAGVSPAAPYRHFKDRDALLDEVAREGFERFAVKLEAAWNDGQPSPLRAFEAVGQAYLDFAAAERPLFAAMFLPRQEMEPALRAASDRAFAVLLVAAARLAEHLPPERRPPVSMVSYHVWAFSHGIAELFTGEGQRRSPIAPGDLLEAGIGVYLRGLGILPDDQE
ncbi:MAG: TetR/AcrR family transcriptional regulator [Pseudomonadota bacterium]